MKTIKIKKNLDGYWGEKSWDYGIFKYISNGYSSWNKMSYWKTLSGITKFIKRQYPDCKIVEDLKD